MIGKEICIIEIIIAIALIIVVLIIKLITSGDEIRCRQQKIELENKIDLAHSGVVVDKKVVDLYEYSITIEADDIEYKDGKQVRVINPKKTFTVSEYTYFSYKIGDSFDSHDFITENHLPQQKTYSRL